MSKPVIMIGNGGHAAVLLEILIAQKRKILGYTAPEQNKSLFNLPYLGTDEAIKLYGKNKIDLVLGLGTVSVSLHRKAIFEAFIAHGYSFANVIHSAAILSPSVQLGQGIQIMAGAILQTNAKISDNSIINTGTIIEHDSSIGKHSHIAPGTTLSGGVLIGENCHIGTGTSIIQGISIGDGTLVGAGSVVVNDIVKNKKVYGVPAKEV
ncbi:acetyltransferase [Psychrobacillus sp. FSL K6-4615]|uniref:acetyltransferase n=1 Tax=Psychrobacillus sp. FSL K6-4615 TaxID=2921551 RepID=UPI0030F9BCF4